MTAVLALLTGLLGWGIGRWKPMRRPYYDQMNMCDHWRRYGECAYCKHMALPPKNNP